MIPYFINERLVSAARRPDALILHPHAQRTGGNTIRRHVLTAVFGEDKIYNAFNVPDAKPWENLKDSDVEGFSAVTGHFNFTPIKLNRVCLPIAVLRHPVYRAASLYSFVKRKSGHRLHALANQHTLEDFYPKASAIAPRYLQNVQCMRICDVARASVAAAYLQDRYLAVGFTENIGEFANALGARLGWPHLDIKEKGADSAHYEPLISPAFREMVLSDNAEDMKLFDIVRAGPPFATYAAAIAANVATLTAKKLRRTARGVVRRMRKQ